MMTWANANTWAANLNINGVTGWRLPTVSPIDGTTANDVTLGYNGTRDRGFNVSAPGTLYAGSTASEMAHLFYNTLGDLSECNPTASTASICVQQQGSGLTNTGPFSNTQSDFVPYPVYWSATDYAPSTGNAWVFSTGGGAQGYGDKADYLSVWAVHSGDVGVAASSSTVPLPAAAWLFGSGLLGLIGVVRRKKKAA